MYAIEGDPGNMDLSYKMIEVYQSNFGRYGCKVFPDQVEKFDWTIPGDRPFLLQVSPVCSNFSAAKTGAQESFSDISQAQAIAAGIAKTQPEYFILENVPQYLRGDSFNIIETSLRFNNYTYSLKIIDLADYGIPQHRKRLFVIASHPDRREIKFPPVQRRMGWGDVIDWSSIEECSPTPKQQKALEARLKECNENSLLIERYGVTNSGRMPQVKNENEPCWTLTKSMFTDGKGSGRRMCIGGWDRLLGWFYLPFSEIKKIAGFPDWYTLPEDPAIAGSILGYAVPPKFIELLIKSNFAL